MSHETLTVQGDKISWMLIPTFEGRVMIGPEEFDRTDFNIAVLEFLGGQKQIPIGMKDEDMMIIPDNIKGNVRLNSLEMPYGQFVEGVIWNLQQGGRLEEEFQKPWFHSQMVAVRALEEELKQQVPERNEAVLKGARYLKAVRIIRLRELLSR